MDFLQLVQLNFKNILMLCKLFLTAIIVSSWTKISVSFQNIFSETNVHFLWYYVLIYLLFYLFFSAFLGLIAKILFHFLKKRIKTKGKEIELGIDITILLNSLKEKTEINLYPKLAKAITNHDDIVNLSIDLAVVLIQLYLILHKAILILPVVIIPIILPLIMLSFHCFNEYYKSQREQSTNN